MATAENIAIERRVARLERQISDQTLLRIRTTLVVYGRGHEPEYSTLEEVLVAAELPPNIVELERHEDLDVLLSPSTQTKRVRSLLEADRQLRFDALKERDGVRLVDVEISCHAKQRAAILSRAPIVGTFGGNRSGKSKALEFWLFRRTLLRGGPGAEFWWIGPTCEKLVTQGVWGLTGAEGLGGGSWPDEVFVELRGCPRQKKHPVLNLVDGSAILFQHANFRGESAGQNLKSALVTDAVVDELGAIPSEANWHQAQIRVSGTGGSVAGSTTRVTDHWSHTLIELRAREVGPQVIELVVMDLFDNPWLSYAKIWKLFIADGTLTVRQLEQLVLPAEDKRAACLALITNAKSLREHFGIETARSLSLWPKWSDRLIYPSSPTKRRATITIQRDGKRVTLLNITAPVLARKWPVQASRGQRWHAWVAVDFNVRGHAVVLEVFAEGPTLEHAVANTNSWTALVSEEIQVDGTTQDLAIAVRDRVGIVPVWYDPHGAPGHIARGTGTTTDAEIFRQLGFPSSPANSVNINTGKPLQLSQIDSRNVMHGLMAVDRFFVDETCSGFITAMSKERARPDGRVAKRSSPDSKTDYLSGFTDATRYGLWPIFRDLFTTPPTP